jgi:hypothetical protein
MGLQDHWVLIEAVVLVLTGWAQASKVQWMLIVSVVLMVAAQLLMLMGWPWTCWLRV